MKRTLDVSLCEREKKVMKGTFKRKFTRAGLLLNKIENSPQINLGEEHENVSSTWHGIRTFDFIHPFNFKLAQVY